MNNKLLNLIVFGILNWAVNISFIWFLWSVNQFFCILLTGLCIFREVAKIMITKIIRKEQQEMYEMALKNQANFGDYFAEHELSKKEVEND